MIEGVIVTPLKQISNDKGDIYHAMKSSDNGYVSFGEAYFSTVYYKEIKGWKKHREMVLNLIVPIGIVKFVIYDDRSNSPTYNEFNEFVIGLDNYCRLTVPPGLWVSFQGAGRDTNMLLNLASIIHDPEESTNCGLEHIKFNWN